MKAGVDPSAAAAAGAAAAGIVAAPGPKGDLAAETMVFSGAFSLGVNLVCVFTAPPCLTETTLTRSRTARKLAGRVRAGDWRMFVGPQDSYVTQNDTSSVTTPRFAPTDFVGRHPLAGTIRTIGAPGHAEKESHRASARGRARRKGGNHAGRRVHPRGDAPHPGRQARRAVGQAGDRDRPFQGEARRRAARATREGRGLGQDPHAGCARPCECERGAVAAAPQPETLARNAARPEAQGTEGRVAHGAIPAGAPGRASSRCSRPEGVGEKGGAHKDAGSAQGRGQKGRTDTTSSVWTVKSRPAGSGAT